MRSCPVCEANGVRLAALVAAAFQSTSRCAACGSGLKLTWVSGILSSAAFAAGLMAWLVSQSLAAGAIVGILMWTAVLFAPLEIDETDPIAFRRKLRESARQKKAAADDH